MPLAFIYLLIMQGAIALVKIFFSFFHDCVRLDRRIVPRGEGGLNQAVRSRRLSRHCRRPRPPWKATTGAALED
jgi:hypothetical protein